jgi:hypothetical protein
VYIASSTFGLIDSPRRDAAAAPQKVVVPAPACRIGLCWEPS